jgi:hypothetical protein
MALLPLKYLMISSAFVPLPDARIAMLDLRMMINGQQY